METLVTIAHFIAALFLILTILLQSGKGADIGAAFGAGSSQTVFGPREAATFLHKITIGAAMIFLVTSISLAYMAKQTKKSVLEEAGVTTTEEEPTLPPPEPSK